MTHDEVVGKIASAFFEGVGRATWGRGSGSRPPSLTGVEADIVVRDADATNPDLRALVFVGSSVKGIDAEEIAICARLTREMPVFVYVPSGEGIQAARELDACGARIESLREYEVGDDGVVLAWVVGAENDG